MAANDELRDLVAIGKASTSALVAWYAFQEVASDPDATATHAERWRELCEAMDGLRGAVDAAAVAVLRSRALVTAQAAPTLRSVQLGAPTEEATESLADRLRRTLRAWEEGAKSRNADQQEHRAVIECLRGILREAGPNAPGGEG